MKIFFYFKKAYIYTLHDWSILPRIISTILFDNLQKKHRFYTVNEIIENIKKGKSIIRFGDGETSLILGESIHFQKYSINLSQKLDDIISSYSNNSDYILCVAERYIQSTNKKLVKKGLLRCWLVSKVHFNYHYPINVLYGDAHMFYVNGFFEKHIVPIIKNKKVVIVTNRYDKNKKKFAIEKIFTNCHWIVVSDEDSFGEYDVVLKKIANLNFGEKETVVIVSAGPMGKVLSYELSKKQIQCLDLGHGITTILSDDTSLEKVLV